jgi:hypothetical protein
VIKRIFSWLTGAAFGLALLLPQAGLAQTAAKPFSNEQLEQMTAPVALYPDSLLAQLFMATTYPDDFAAAAAWSKSHPNDKGDAAVKLVENQPWDPSVASLVAFPEVLITFGDKPDWVRNMGDAFLAQPEDVMNAVQRLRQKAQQAGNLKSNEEIKVSTQKPEAPVTTIVQQSAPPAQVIVIEPAQPSVVYVPAYNPAYVYGPWPYPAYPPYYYPPPPGYWFSRTIATGIAWGIGIGISNALWGGCNWGHGSVNVNVNRYNNINVNRQINANGNRSNWNHNPERRGNTPYRGGDATRQNLDKKYQSGNREQYRGKDTGRDPSRDASRERAAQTMQDRGVAANTGSARDRAQSVDRGAMQQGMQNMDRGAGQQRPQAASRDNALAGAGDRQARQQMDRGAASQQMARPAPAARPAPSGGGARAGGGGGGGARAGGGGGGGRAGGGGRGR